MPNNFGVFLSASVVNNVTFLDLTSQVGSDRVKRPHDGLCIKLQAAFYLSQKVHNYM